MGMSVQSRTVLRRVRVAILAVILACAGSAVPQVAHAAACSGSVGATIVDVPSGLDLAAVLSANVTGSLSHTVINLAPGGYYPLTRPLSIGEEGSHCVRLEGNGAAIEQLGDFAVFRIFAGGEALVDEVEIRGGNDFARVVVFRGGTLALSNSTVHGGSPCAFCRPDMHGLFNEGFVTLVNSTISGNTGSGIVNAGSLRLLSSTVSDNRITGIQQAGGFAELVNSIVAGHGRVVDGAFASGGFNVITNAGDSTGWSAIDRIGSDSARLDARLTPLAESHDPGPDNHTSLPVPLHIPRVGSPALDFAGCIPGGDLGRDARGVTRPVGPGCDAGAFERDATPAEGLADAYDADAGATLTVAAPGVLSNDRGLGAPIVVAEPRPSSGPSHGTLALQGDGALTYTPDTGFTGSDSFTYRPSHGGLLLGTATTVTITVVPVGPPPDTTPPVLSLPGTGDPRTVTERATSAAGAAVTFTATATDESPLAPAVTCSSAAGLTSGSTFPVGTTTVSCSATDAAGNEATGEFFVTVTPMPAPTYSWTGFFSPVDNPAVYNRAKAGSAVPVKFALGGDRGLDIFFADANGPYPRSAAIACSSTAPVDAIEQTVTAGSSNLTYDAATGRYTYVWKTDAKWANTCRQLVVKTKDGAEHRALFTFVR